MLGDTRGEWGTQTENINISVNATNWVFDVPFFCRNYSATISAFTGAGEEISTSIHIPFILPPDAFLGVPGEENTFRSLEVIYNLNFLSESNDNETIIKICLKEGRCRSNSIVYTTREMPHCASPGQSQISHVNHSNIAGQTSLCSFEQRYRAQRRKSLFSRACQACLMYLYIQK